MRYQCPHCERDFSRHTALRNHIKTHESEIDRILREIAEESEEDIERNDEKSGRVSGEKMIIIEEESEDEVNDDEVSDEDQLLEENEMNDDYYINEELVDVQEEEIFDVQEELVDVQEEELVNIQEEMIVVQEELVEDDGSDDQVSFSLIYTTLVVQNILSDLLYYILY